jgi:hypothetical protein
MSVYKPAAGGVLAWEVIRGKTKNDDSTRCAGGLHASS